MLLLIFVYKIKKKERKWTVEGSTAVKKSFDNNKLQLNKQKGPHDKIVFHHQTIFQLPHEPIRLKFFFESWNQTKNQMNFCLVKKPKNGCSFFLTGL